MLFTANNNKMSKLGEQFNRFYRGAIRHQDPIIYAYKTGESQKCKQLKNSS